MKHIEGNYYLDHSGQQFTLKEDTGRVAKDSKTSEEKKVYKEHGYYSKPEHALDKYVSLKVAHSKATNIVELAEEIRCLKSFFKSQFQ